MKNQYQEALKNLYSMRSKLIDVSSKNIQWANNIEIYDFIGVQLRTLQELVEKEFGVKPFKESLADRLCGKCHCYINFDAINNLHEVVKILNPFYSVKESTMIDDVYLLIMKEACIEIPSDKYKLFKKVLEYDL